MALSSADRILVARLTGIAARHASGIEARNAEQLGEEPGDPVAELRAVSVDRHLLSVAAAMYVDSDHNYGPGAARLLELAGADLVEARAWRSAHPPRGFRPPQARPGGGQDRPSQ